jgi:glycosyltransferase involved in cell wall biosynthesis
MPFPKITVLTLSFNQGEFLEKTITSVLDQAYPNLEYIIMDGGSTDNSVEIIEKYADKLSYWQSQPDGGQSAAINAGFARATGDILCWLNSDDYFALDTLEKVGKYFTDHPDCRWLAGNGTAINPDGRTLELPARMDGKHGLLEFWEWGKSCYFLQPSVFWRRELWEKSGGKCRADKPNSMDHELWIRFDELTDLVIVPESFAVTNLHDQCKSIKNSSVQKLESIQSALEHAKRRNINLKISLFKAWQSLHCNNLFKAIKAFDCRNSVKYCMFIAVAPFAVWTNAGCLYMWKRMLKYEDILKVHSPQSTVHSKK